MASRVLQRISCLKYWKNSKLHLRKNSDQNNSKYPDDERLRTDDLLLNDVCNEIAPNKKRANTVSPEEKQPSAPILGPTSESYKYSVSPKVQNPQLNVEPLVASSSSKDEKTNFSSESQPFNVVPSVPVSTSDKGAASEPNKISSPPTPARPYQNFDGLAASSSPKDGKINPSSEHQSPSTPTSQVYSVSPPFTITPPDPVLPSDKGAGTEQYKFSAPPNQSDPNRSVKQFVATSFSKDEFSSEMQSPPASHSDSLPPHFDFTPPIPVSPSDKAARSDQYKFSASPQIPEPNRDAESIAARLPSKEEKDDFYSGSQLPPHPVSSPLTASPPTSTPTPNVFTPPLTFSLPPSVPSLSTVFPPGPVNPPISVIPSVPLSEKPISYPLGEVSDGTKIENPTKNIYLFKDTGDTKDSKINIERENLNRQNSGATEKDSTTTPDLSTTNPSSDVSPTVTPGNVENISTKAPPTAVSPPVPVAPSVSVIPPIPVTPSVPVTQSFPVTPPVPVPPPVPVTQSVPVTPPVPVTQSIPVTPPVPVTPPTSETPPVPVKPPVPASQSFPVFPPISVTQSVPPTDKPVINPSVDTPGITRNEVPVRKPHLYKDTPLIEERQINIGRGNPNKKNSDTKINDPTTTPNSSKTEEPNPFSKIIPTMSSVNVSNISPTTSSTSTISGHQVTSETKNIRKKGSEIDFITPEAYKALTSKKFAFGPIEHAANAEKSSQKSSFKQEINIDESIKNSGFEIPLAPTGQSVPGYQPIPSDRPMTTILPKEPLKPFKKVATTFEAVPGPMVLKTVGNVWKYVPILGTQFVATFIYAIQAFISSYDRKMKYSFIYPYYYLLNKYGPMVRLHSPIGANIVILGIDGQNFPIIPRKQKDKIRSLFDSLNSYRACTKSALASASFSSLDKRKLEGNISLNVDKYYAHLEESTDHFLQKGGTFIKGHVGAEVQDQNHEVDLKKWALQSTLDVYFKTNKNILTDSKQKELFESFLKASMSLRLNETGLQLWRVMPTFSWIDLIDNCKYLDRFIINEAQKSVSNLNKGNPSSSVLEALISNEELRVPDNFVTPLLDVLFINVNTVSSTVGFLLRHMAKTPNVQRNMFREVSRILPKGHSKIARSELFKLRYLNACIKETLRMAPPFPFLSRELEVDTRIHGFLVPKGTFIQMVNLLPCTRGSSTSEDIGKFQAERWLETRSKVSGDPLLGIPKWNSFPEFNKDLVMTQIALLMTKIVREYRVDLLTNDIYPDNMVLTGPTKPFNFNFIERQL